MSIEYMRNFLKQKYGKFIKGQLIDNMHDYQVLAIYTRIVQARRA